MNKKILSIILSVTTILTLAGCSKKDIDRYINKIFHKSDNTSFITDINSKSKSNSNDNTTYKASESNVSTTIESKDQESSTSNYDNSITSNIEIPDKQKEDNFREKQANLYTIDDLKLRDDCSSNSDVLDVIDKYNKVLLIKENKDWCYVSYNGNKGYVKRNYVKELGDTFVEVDISDQMLYLYKDSELIYDSNVVTGKKDVFDTRLGCNTIKSKISGTYLEGGEGKDHYKVWVNYWMPFDGGIGIHDAPWRDNFSNDAYIYGSHGCVNMKYEDAQKVYENVNIGTKVLVHE